MTHDPNAWDAGLAGLLDAERGNVTAPADAEDRVWGRLALGIGPGPGNDGGGGAHAGPRPVVASKLASPFAGATLYILGVVTGVVASVLVMHAASRDVPAAPVRAPVADTIAVDRETAAPAMVAALTTTADANTPMPPRATAVAPPRLAPSAEHTLQGERVLLDEARAALGRADGAAALRATTTHAQRYPQGLLAEEREAIAIQALLLVPRYDDARQREAAFEHQYPHSMLLQAVRASVQSIP